MQKSPGTGMPPTGEPATSRQAPSEPHPKFYRLLLENIDLGIAVFDEHYRLRMVNQALARQLGKPHQQLIGKPCHQALWEKPDRCRNCAAQRALREGKKLCIKGRRITVGEVHRFFDISVLPMGSAASQNRGFIKVFRDVSCERQIEAARRESELRFATLADSTPVMVWMSGQNQSLSYVNKKWCELTGLSAKQALGQPRVQVVHEQDAPGFSRSYAKAFEARKFFSMEYRMRRFDGDYRWVLDSGAPRFAPDGAFLGYIGSCIDITDHKMAEEQLLMLNESLEQRILERTRELEAANQELRTEVTQRIALEKSLLCEKSELEAAKQKLEATNQELKESQVKILRQEKMASIGQLAAGVAHEINNPMGFITSNLGSLENYLGKLTEFMGAQQRALKSGSVPSEARAELAQKRKQLKVDYVLEDIEELIRDSLDGASRVKEIVQDLKVFSRVDQVVEHQVADINECLNSSINMAWNEIKYKASLDKQFADLPPTLCYPQQLGQVFLNLLVNAAQAIEQQGEIRVRSWLQDRQIMISVTDSGRGIPTEVQERIFEPFFTTKEVGQGTGLGLSISYDIIKKHQGDIWVESVPGKGTTFTISLPLRQGA